MSTVDMRIKLHDAFKLVERHAHWAVVLPSRTRCKHRRGACERCGTTDTRDAIHTTTRGRGVVSAAIERSRR